MEYSNYAMQYFICIMKIELMKEKNVCAPKNGPVWLESLINYLLEEYANSHIGLYTIGEALSQKSDFSSLKNYLLTIEIHEFTEANKKNRWKEKN